MKKFRVLLVSGLFALPAAARAQIGDFTNWFVVQDPPNARFSAATALGNATLNASGGPVTAGTDIGCQTINGTNAASSTNGYAFDPATNFTIAIDYSLALTNSPLGNLGLGFGIGEDKDGTNSAGVTIVTTNGGFSVYPSFVGAARINDTTQTPSLIALPASLSGSMFVTYTASTGTVTVGASYSPGVTKPAASTNFTGIQNSWSGRDLIASFFIRSQDPGWVGGNAQAVFSNFRILSGTPVRIAPVVTSTSHSGGVHTIAFKGGIGGKYQIFGGSGLTSFPDNLTLSPGTSIVETPAASGLFQATVDISAKGPRYFLRIASGD